MICALMLIMACGSHVAPLLNVASSAAWVADTWSTQRLFDLCRRDGGCDVTKVEHNPLLRPVMSHGQTVAYAGNMGMSFATNYLAGRLRVSNNRVLRRLWWAPQIGLIIGKAIAVRGNMRGYDRTSLICGCPGPIR